MGLKRYRKCSLAKQMLALCIKIEHCCETYGRYKKVFKTFLAFPWLFALLYHFLLEGIRFIGGNPIPYSTDEGSCWTTNEFLYSNSTSLQVGESRDFQEGSSLFQEPCRKYSVRALVEFGGGDGKWTNDKSVLKQKFQIFF